MTTVELVEVAILSTKTHYDSYGDDSHTALSPLLGSNDWVKVTKEELRMLVENRYEIASAVGVESLIVIEKPTTAQVGMGLDVLRKLMAKKEAERLASIERQAKRQKALDTTAQERKIAKAKKDLAKAQKILAEAGGII